MTSKDSSDAKLPTDTEEASSSGDGQQGPTDGAGPGTASAEDVQTKVEDDMVEKIRKYIATKLGITDELDQEQEPTSVTKVLISPDLEGVVNYIKEKKVSKIITMAGAGISTAAGIPDFRSPGSGLYNNLAKYNLPDPQAIFDIQFFKSNPKPFFDLAKELYPGQFKPTKSHYFIKLLHEKGLLLRHYTQNIDTLERIAGIPSEKLVEAHGTFHTGHCLRCGAEYSQEWIKDIIFKDQIPSCTKRKCQSGIVKPDIIFFGENLPARFHNLLSKDFKECELLIILGSSLVVQPFGSLIDHVDDEVPRILINREKAGEKSRLHTMLNIGGGLDFSDPSHRDVAILGECDDGCQKFADELGWGQELKDLVVKQHILIDQVTKKKQEEAQCTKQKEEKHEGGQTSNMQNMPIELQVTPDQKIPQPEIGIMPKKNICKH